MGVAVAELNDNKCLLLFQLLLVVVVVAVGFAFVFAVSQQRQTPSTRLPFSFPLPACLCTDACRLPSVVVVLTWQEGVLNRRRYSIKMNNSLFIVEQ